MFSPVVNIGAVFSNLVALCKGGNSNSNVLLLVLLVSLTQVTVLNQVLTPNIFEVIF